MPEGANIGSRPRILLVEDEDDLANEIRKELQDNGYAVQRVETCEEGLEAARSGEIVIMILNCGLRAQDSLAIIAALRDEGNSVPIIVIGDQSTVDDRIRCLKAGGDEYLVKPINVRELSARVDALLRRTATSQMTKLRVGPLEMDLIERAVWCDGKFVHLLPREFRLLEYFMRRPGKLVTRTMLIRDIWRYRIMPETNVIDVHLTNLRRKLEAACGRRFIFSVRGEGFMLAVGD